MTLIEHKRAASQLAAAEAACDELIEDKAAVDAEIADIKLQLDQARGRMRLTGEYADPVWYARATYALRMKGRKSQALQREIGEATRWVRKLRNGEIERCFVAAARAELDPSTFTRVWTVAERLREQRIGDGV